MPLSISDKPTEILQRIALFVGDPAKTERISTSFKEANRAALYRYLFRKYEKNTELAFYCNAAKRKYEKTKMSEEERDRVLVKEVYTRVIKNGLSLLDGKKLLFDHTPYFVSNEKIILSSSKLSPIRLHAIAKAVAPNLEKKAMDLILAFKQIAEQNPTAKNLPNLMDNDTVSSNNGDLLKIAEEMSLWMLDKLQSKQTWFKGTKRFSKLELCHLSLSFFPEEITHATALRKLNVSNNHLEHLPESFANLTNLKKLNLDRNAMSALPDGFEKLKKLKVLQLSNNRFETLPDCFEHFSNLKTISVFNNSLKHLPKSFYQLAHLKQLSLKHNLLTSLSESFGNLKQLEELDLSENKIDVLPNSFGNLRKLKLLDLTDNDLETLPDSFGHLKQLKEFKIADNALQALPSSFGNLKHLEILDLNNNYLATLPVSFRNLTKIQVVHLDNNHFESIPEKIYRSSNTVIKYHSVLRNFFYI
ncbi:MAG TPA: leucine-rich repeat domain-containing protein [Rhabdochlamydiaceae bacterium]|nr:leucine-rich repeat domain-containing protein [Rhabdochlamydiaceae bacterium]